MTHFPRLVPNSFQVLALYRTFLLNSKLAFKSHPNSNKYVIQEIQSRFRKNQRLVRPETISDEYHAGLKLLDQLLSSIPPSKFISTSIKDIDLSKIRFQEASHDASIRTPLARAKTQHFCTSSEKSSKRKAVQNVLKTEKKTYFPPVTTIQIESDDPVTQDIVESLFSSSLFGETSGTSQSFDSVGSTLQDITPSQAAVQKKFSPTQQPPFIDSNEFFFPKYTNIDKFSHCSKAQPFIKSVLDNHPSRQNLDYYYIDDSDDPLGWFHTVGQVGRVPYSSTWTSTPPNTSKSTKNTESSGNLSFDSYLSL